MQSIISAFKKRSDYLFIGLLIYVFQVVIIDVNAQTAQQRAFLSDFAATKAAEFELQKEEAIRLAAIYGIPVTEEYDDGSIIELMRFEQGIPIYYRTNNLEAAKTISTDDVWAGPLNLNGQGEILGIWDGGGVSASHNELNGRVLQKDLPAQIRAHATHVAGTMIATGVRPQAKGMANMAHLHAWDWNNDIKEMADAAKSPDDLLVSNHSYGEICGWYWNRNNSTWYWFGESTKTEDYKFGFYDEKARDWDVIAENAPYFLIIKAAGNDRNDAWNGIHAVFIAGTGWQWSNAARQADGGADGFDCIPTYGTAKNILTVGAVNDISNGYQNSNDVVMTSFSSWGPTDDGRIKPDIVANGDGLYSSTYKAGVNDYEFISGTSMSAPCVSGSVALLNQHYKNIHNNAKLRSATMKALIIHTADEAGRIGPDYEFGWGLLNTHHAAELITQDNESGEGLHIREMSLNSKDTLELRVWPILSGPLKITLVWTDPPGTPSVPPTLNPTDKKLVNDLDMRIYEKSTDTEFKPFILDPAQPDLAATNGDNNTDNVEQIIVMNFPATDCPKYVIQITHKGVLTHGSQELSLIITGNQQGVICVKWNANGNNSGVSWEDAYTDFQIAIDQSSPGSEIWVAKGTYMPVSNGTGRYRHFALKNCVEVFGGFNGDENVNTFLKSERKLIDNETILSGDNDRFHVVFNSDLDNTALLDGFTIRGGLANGDWTNPPPPPETTRGGGMYNVECDLVIKNCRLINNIAGIEDIPLTIYREAGGGMFNYNSNPIVINSIISGNNADSCYGGGIYNHSSNPEFVNCLISVNIASAGGGMANYESDPLIINSTIAGNQAFYEGGGIYNDYDASSSLTLQNSIVWGNLVLIEDPILEKYKGHQISNPEGNSVTLQYCCVAIGGDYNIFGNGIITFEGVCLFDDPLFVAPVLRANPNPTIAGDYHLTDISPAIDAGDNEFVPPGTNQDLDWKERISIDIVDMGPYEFQKVCYQPCNLKILATYADMAQITWSPGSSNESEWNLEWGLCGFTQGSGNQVNSINTLPYSLSGLSPATYDVYVQAVCSPDKVSAWTGPKTFTIYPTNLTVFDFGDAPEGVVAYPSTGVIGKFPTCLTSGPAAFIQHSYQDAYFGPLADLEADGNGGMCSGFLPDNYDNDESYLDGDAGLIYPSVFTIVNGEVVPCIGTETEALGGCCIPAFWGTNIDINITNNLSELMYVNVLMDWNQDGMWGGTASCTIAAPEHVLIDFPVPAGFIGSLSSLDPPGFITGPLSGEIWTRFTLSDQSVMIDPITKNRSQYRQSQTGSWPTFDINNNLSVPDPEFDEEFQITYCSGAFNGAYGMDEGGTFEVAAYFPSSYMELFSETKLARMEFYIHDLPDLCKIKIYGPGTPVQPGALVYEQIITPLSESWNVVELDEPLEMTGEDLWIGYEVTHLSETYPVGYDYGPQDPGKGNMIRIGDDWQELTNINPQLTYNWDLVGYLIRPSFGWDGSGIFQFGETEDYMLVTSDLITSEYDLGDAPDPPYPTLVPNFGAYHFVDNIIFMGFCVDTDSNGQPSANADGDDLDNLDDEDGVTFITPLTPNEEAIVHVVANSPCMLNAWIDFNQTNAWTDAGEHIFVDQLLTAGLNELSFIVPADAVLGQTFARFRVNPMGGISYNDDGGPGEVEDYQVLIGQELIPGDANDDGVVNVLDIITIVNYILGLNPVPFNFENADVNNDGVINVLDIIGTVNIILGGGKVSIYSEPADIYLDRDLIRLRSDGTLAGIQFELKGPDLQNIELQLVPEGYQLGYSISDEILTGIIFHPLNQPIPEGMIDLIRLTGVGTIIWGEVVAGNANPEEVPVNKHLLISDDFDFEVYPNPSRDGFVVRMFVPHDSKISLKLVDLTGRDHIFFNDMYYPVGIHSYYVYSSKHFIPGIYLMQMKAVPGNRSGEAVIKQLKVVVLK